MNAGKCIRQICHRKLIIYVPTSPSSYNQLPTFNVPPIPAYSSADYSFQNGGLNQQSAYMQLDPPDLYPFAPAINYFESQQHREVKEESLSASASPVTLYHSAAPSPVASTSHDSRSSSQDTGNPQLLLFGIPPEGTRTRVETQIKVTLMLLRPAADGNQTLPLVDEDGVAVAGSLRRAERVGDYKWLRLPAFAAIKRKNKKHYRTGIPLEETLTMTVKVVKSTDESEEVYCCHNCQEREVCALHHKLRPRFMLHTTAKTSRKKEGQ